ncbi:uncharacterized protein LOC129592037 isoform X2 [Paramacrobiotus metropolitanus]|uniref:uncharacterized protein LOC129592037 isoform X2 n=1 Tax=Paramacrobiotus metropolitanus TaxID=2943436 RepID=UPI002445AB66|nr:uncharacterized protein LOC129592037 isoform X2 [Paramacrobiotus metropolitanus]
MAGGGVAELQFVGYGCGGLALLIIALAIPTTCILPYHEYALLHIVNYTLPLILVVASLRVAFAAQDGLALSVDVRQLMLRMTFAIGLIAVFFYDASLCNQVLNQVAKKTGVISVPRISRCPRCIGCTPSSTCSTRSSATA